MAWHAHLKKGTQLFLHLGVHGNWPTWLLAASAAPRPPAAHAQPAPPGAWRCEQGNADLEGLYIDWQTLQSHSQHRLLKAG